MCKITEKIWNHLCTEAMTLCISFTVGWSAKHFAVAFTFAADNVLRKINVVCLPQISFEMAWNGDNNLATETMLKYKNKHYTMLEKKILRLVRVRKSEISESAVNLKFEFESFPLTIQLISKNVPRLCSTNRHWVEKKFCSLFSIFCLKSHHQIYSNVSKAKPSQLCNRCLFHITSCKWSFTSAFKCVITSVPSAEQQSVLRKISTSFLPCLLFLFGERSESVRNPSDRHTQTPQKPERVDESRTQTHRNQTARPVDRSGYCSQKKEHNTR